MNINIKLIICNFVLLALFSCNNKNKEEDFFDLLLEKKDVAVEINASTTLKIIQGNSDYAIFSNNENIARAELTKDNTILIKGISIGTTYLVIKDKKKESVSISVTVGPWKEILLDSKELFLVPDLVQNINILQGTSKYDLHFSDENIVKVSQMTDNYFSLEGVNTGVTTVYITDMADKTKTTTINVNVIKNTPLSDWNSHIICQPDNLEGYPSSVSGFNFFEFSEGIPIFKFIYVVIERYQELRNLNTSEDLCKLYNSKEKKATYDIRYFSPSYIVLNNDGALHLFSTGNYSIGNNKYTISLTEKH